MLRKRRARPEREGRFFRVSQELAPIEHEGLKTPSNRLASATGIIDRKGPKCHEGIDLYMVPSGIFVSLAVMVVKLSHTAFLAFLGPNDPVMIVLLALRFFLQLALFHHLAFVRGFEP